MKKSSVAKLVVTLYAIALVPLNYVAQAGSIGTSPEHVGDVIDSIGYNRGGAKDWFTGGLSNGKFSDGLKAYQNKERNNGQKHYTATHDDTNNYARVDGQAQITYDVAPGEYHYVGADQLGRTQAAYARITADNRQKAKERDRQDLPTARDQQPSGWGNNQKVTVNITPDTTYSGYFWNRSHLIADSLGGEPIKDNLITGTRGQNVGNNKGQGGGMGYTETQVRVFLDNPINHQCDVYYAATPHYEGSELIPRFVTVDVQSCHKEIDEHVIVSNTMPGYLIDYRDGTIKKENS